MKPTKEDREIAARAGLANPLAAPNKRQRRVIAEERDAFLRRAKKEEAELKELAKLL